MTVAPDRPALEPRDAARRLGDWGFVAHADLPDAPGPAFLIVSLRDRPTLRHFDPEVIELWRAEAGRGVRRTIDRHTRLPGDARFSWGSIRVVDRVHAVNVYVTFGGRVLADDVDGARVVVLVSPAPLLRSGGHSQTADTAADDVAAFFARLVGAIEERPGLEGRLAAASPISLYAAFLEDAANRLHRSPSLAATRHDLCAIVAAERARLHRDERAEWEAGTGLLAVAGFGTSTRPARNRSSCR
ncbi:MAG TPA: hypothetical protein VFI28_07630 [Candidatus Limnocylindrales bacterium]|nr:hypothetical protein [Candidatus Limnocylindrales bacterium]